MLAILFLQKLLPWSVSGLFPWDPHESFRNANYLFPDFHPIICFGYPSATLRFSFRSMPQGAEMIW